MSPSTPENNLPVCSAEQTRWVALADAIVGQLEKTAPYLYQCTPEQIQKYMQAVDMAFWLECRAGAFDSMKAEIERKAASGFSD